MGERSRAFGAVAFAELLDLVAALNGGFGGGRGKVSAAAGDGVGNILPVGGAEITFAESVPLIAVGVEQSERLFVGPARRGKAAGRGIGGRRRSREAGHDR